MPHSEFGGTDNYVNTLQGRLATTFRTGQDPHGDATAGQIYNEISRVTGGQDRTSRAEKRTVSENATDREKEIGRRTEPAGGMTGVGSILATVAGVFVLYQLFR